TRPARSRRGQRAREPGRVVRGHDPRAAGDDDALRAPGPLRRHRAPAARGGRAERDQPARPWGGDVRGDDPKPARRSRPRGAGGGAATPPARGVEEPSMGLQGRLALVTGAGAGIGAATALRLAQEGAAVAVLDRDADGVRGTVEAVQAAGGVALGLVGDVSDRASVEQAIHQVVEQRGRLDILINNAGINRDAMAVRMTEEQWDAVLDVNLKGTFLC